MTERLREYENFHIVLWIMKDTCWLMEWKIGGVIMITPTILAALHITWLSRKNLADFFHNITISNWICGNAVWMIGEFFYDDTFRPFAKIFFAIGLAFLMFYYFIVLPREKRAQKEQQLLIKH